MRVYIYIHMYVCIYWTSKPPKTMDPVPLMPSMLGSWAIVFGTSQVQVQTHKYTDIYIYIHKSTYIYIHAISIYIYISCM